MWLTGFEDVTGTVVEVDVDTRRGRSLCRIRTRLANGRERSWASSVVDPLDPTSFDMWLRCQLIRLLYHLPLLRVPNGRHAVSVTIRVRLYVYHLPIFPDARLSPQSSTIGDDDDPTTTIFHLTLRLRPDRDSLARFVRVNSRWAWDPDSGCFGPLPLPSFYPPPSIGARHLPHRRPVLDRNSPLFTSTSVFAAPADAPCARWLVALGRGPGHRLHWASSPSFVLPSFVHRRFASHALTLTALHLFSPFFFLFDLDSHREDRGVRQGARKGTLGLAYHGTRFHDAQQDTDLEGGRVTIGEVLCWAFF
ncbi:hypothetical protein R3P38DRAFT_3174820 [Favolaschia claudopus]|uniref:Uncharacterized protein n=1 Tax=Favolaschia claudopus TaxID=2862362 RepID=A0AAW0DDH4_9AGAR